MTETTAKIEKAKSDIKAGFYAALVSLAITLVVTILGATGSADLGFGADWYMLIDVGLIGAFAIGIWFKSRVAATGMFLYFLLSKILLIAEGQYGGILMGVLFLYFYGRAMIASYSYHKLIKRGVAGAEVF
jgi:hypothetical protein